MRKWPALYQPLFGYRDIGFSNELRKQNLHWNKVFSPVLGSIFLAFCILDMLLAPEFFWKFLSFRLAYFLFTILLTLASHFVRYQFSYVLSFLLMFGAGVLLSVFSYYYVDQQELIIRSFFLTLLCSGFFFQWPPVYTFVTNSLAISFYFGFRMIFKTYQPLLPVDLLFLVSTMVGSIMANYVIYFLRYQDYQNAKKLEESYEQLKELDKLKNNFLANLSHELKTPLSLILSPVESVLQGDLKRDQKTMDSILQSIQRNGLNLLGLITQLLNFSQIEAGKLKLYLQKVDLMEILRSHLNGIQPSAEVKRIKTLLKTHAPRVELYLDVEKFDKVISNLLVNSLKFTPEGGKILVSVRENEENDVLLEVEDTGIGIPREKLSTVFDRFFQVDSGANRRYQGFGIGLSLVKEYVHLHGQSIEVESRDKEAHPRDHGTRFTLTIKKDRSFYEARKHVSFVSASEPGYMPPRQHKNVIGLDYKTLINQTPQAPEAASSKKTSVLVVEDHPELLNYLYDILKEEHQVFIAANGKDGLSKARQHKPSLILTDIMMPIMDGNEMVVKVRKSRGLGKIPVVFLTARSDIHQLSQSFQIGFVDYLIKPFHPKELTLRIQNLLDLQNLHVVKGMVKEEKDLREELEAAHKKLKNLHKARENFFSHLSHEIRTPLSIMLMIIERTMRNMNRKMPMEPEDIKTLREYVFKITHLVDNILELAKLKMSRRKLRFKKVDVGKFFEDFIQSNQHMAKLKNISLSYQLHTKPKTFFYIDSSLLQRALTNLLHNSLKNVKENGAIRLEVSQSDGNHHIRFADNGMGIRKEILPHIFEEFFQEEAKGIETFVGGETLPTSTGLGLSIVQKVVQLHKGSINVESKHIGQFKNKHGCVFTIKIPEGLNEPENQKVDEFEVLSAALFSEKKQKKRFPYETDMKPVSGEMETERSEGNQEQKTHILLVEDDMIMLKLMKEALIKNGYTVSTAVDGQEALKIAKKDTPDMVITDLMMPVMDGAELIERMGETPSLQETPVIVLSGQRNLAELDHAMIRAKCMKPISESELLKVIKNNIH